MENDFHRPIRGLIITTRASFVGTEVSLITVLSRINQRRRFALYREMKACTCKYRIYTYTHVERGGVGGKQSVTKRRKQREGGREREKAVTWRIVTRVET